MKIRVPDVNRCFCCLPLRPGILLFAYLNIIFSVVSVTCLVITTEIQKASITNDISIDVMVSTVLFSILGMGIILNFLLLIAGYQKDVSMLRLYNYYALATTLAALVTTCFLLSKKMFVEVFIALLVIAMQCYVIVLVRSEVVQLEESELRTTELTHSRFEDHIDISDQVTLV
ncbi:unnamed protein product [Euphydryas editha]|uniref:Uncharacterized protein n=1 Tax=Euphydryas editha TaxID=104508 RepID=A0AAU9V5A1_EUPED|nr:unnamed protein product [Euphydryas editha]